jgi:hypothetical protein
VGIQWSAIKQHATEESEMPASESVVSTRRNAAQWKVFVGGCIDLCSAEGV